MWSVHFLFSNTSSTEIEIISLPVINKSNQSYKFLAKPVSSFQTFQVYKVKDSSFECVELINVLNDSTWTGFDQF